jgi:hypothetical protein
MTIQSAFAFFSDPEVSSGRKSDPVDLGTPVFSLSPQPGFNLSVDQLRGQPLEMCVRKPRGPFLTSPLGANFDPRGRVVPQW